MKISATALLLAGIVSSICALLMAFWAGMPWWSISGLGILFIGLLVMDTFPLQSAGSWARGSAAIGTILGLGYLLFGPHYLDGFHVVWGILVALPVFLGCFYWKSRSTIRWWRSLAIVWAQATDFVWLASAYDKNDRLGFYAALLLCIALLILTKKWFRLPSSAVLGLNTAILIIVGLPVANLLVSPADSLGIPPPLSAKPYSYEFFKRDPAGYMRWLNYYDEQSRSIFQKIYVHKPEGPLTYQLRAGGEGVFCESKISINQKGFRGAEIPGDKKNTYRIVVLGESTTFGWTLYADQKPWPELLENMINERLKPGRPVEVINAGVPAYNIIQNLYRIPSQILPLKPDMLISYHGYNGFSLVNASLPPVVASKPPPVYQRRPLKLLADLEFHIKLNRFKKNLVGRSTQPAAPAQDPMSSEYANAYRELIRICHTNNIHLVLSTYSMAVNQQSDADVIQFYHGTILSLPTVLQACVVHNGIVCRLAAAEPELGFVDTRPGLDGIHEKFIDVMHFAPEGDQQMAEVFFAGIKDNLVKDLARAANSR